MKYRDRNDIIAQILESSNGNRVRLTKIMYDVYLSHGLTKEYVGLLIEKGLMEYLEGERTFKTTDKGMNFLSIHNRSKNYPHLASNCKVRVGRFQKMTLLARSKQKRSKTALLMDLAVVAMISTPS